MKKVKLKNKLSKIIATYLLICFVTEIFFPTAAWALTSGPAQEEYASFEPFNSSEFVDLYTGDFTYNIPLMTVPGPNGGYPINMAYHGGITMEQEASWVGLGWSLNVGAINRNLRGLPDDFNGEEITKYDHMKKNWTVGLEVPVGSFAYTELLGKSLPSANSFSSSVQINYNSYKGLGYRVNLNQNAKFNDYISANLNVSFDSQSGLGIDPKLSLSQQFGDASTQFNVGMSFNSRQGISGFNFTYHVGSKKLSEKLRGKYQSAYNKMVKNAKNKDKVPAKLSNNVLEKVTVGCGSGYNFGTSFGVPSVQTPMQSLSVPFSFKGLLTAPIGSLVNFTASMAAPNLYFDGFFNSDDNSNDGEYTIPAYGYNNSKAASYNNSRMMDATREPLNYYKDLPHLPSATYTYDMFSVTGQGVGGQFRPYQNAIGFIRDPKVESTQKVRDVGVEAGFTTIVHAGLQLGFGNGENNSGAWGANIGDNDYGSTDITALKNFTSSASAKNYEEVYFAMAGEKTGLDATQDQLNYFVNGSVSPNPLNTITADDAIRFDVEKNTSKVKNKHYELTGDILKSNYQKITGNDIGTGWTSHKSKQVDQQRIRRANNISTLSFGDVKQYGRSRNETFYQSGDPDYISKADQQTAEISIQQPDGFIYTYGLPTLNTKQVENLFTLKSSSTPTNYGKSATLTASSDPDSPAKIDYSDTRDEFVSRTSTPEYVNSWLLTAVYSADYVDINNDGPTNDDFGYWVKFEYEKVDGTYNWRIPFESTKANFIEGYKTNPQDNKGAYTYGEKELYYLKSVKTKTHIAIFTTSPRKDGKEADGEVSGSGSSYLKKLDKIELFSRMDCIDEACTGGTPIKTANMVYNYDLCTGIPNNTPGAIASQDLYKFNSTSTNEIVKQAAYTTNNLGKLTLKNLYFTYQNNTKGKLSPYVFDYDEGTSASNPVYDPRNMDRWGNYKNNIGKYGNNSYFADNSEYPFQDFPYTEQDDDYRDDNAAVWSLKRIHLPSGGTLEVEYEKDDYAYVENKRATSMFDIVDIGSIRTGATGADRNATPVNADPESATKVYFKLHHELDAGDLEGMSNNVYCYKKFIEGLNNKQFYYKIYSHLNDLSDVAWDYVSGYIDISDITLANCSTKCGLEGSGPYKYGYIIMPTVPLSKLNISGLQVSPFTKAAIEHLRNKRPELIHAGTTIPYASDPKDMVINFFGSIGGLLDDVAGLLSGGFNSHQYDKGCGQEIMLNGRSVMKLCEGTANVDIDGNTVRYDKKGGGDRVKTIKIHDDWDISTSASSVKSVYGNKYTYETTNEYGSTISSGIAYEPRMGSEECALRSAVFSDPAQNYAQSHQTVYTELPINYQLYPAEGVGYSKVKVESIAADMANEDDVTNELQNTSAPYSVHEFYTAKDFPVIEQKTDMNIGKPLNSRINIPGVFKGEKRRQMKSQGYSVVLNDMAGKPKSIASYVKKSNKLLSKVEYTYNTKRAYDPNNINELDSRLKTIALAEAGSTTGKDYDYKEMVLGQTHDMFVDYNEDFFENKYIGGFLNVGLTVPTGVPFYIFGKPTISNTENSMRSITMHKVIYRTGVLMKTKTYDENSFTISENVAFDEETGNALLTKTTNKFGDNAYKLDIPGHWYYANLRGAYKNTGMTWTGSETHSGSEYTLTDADKYFVPGDEVLINSKICTVYNVVGDNIAFIDRQGNLLSSTITSIKILKSGYKNLQTVNVGNVNFIPEDEGDIANGIKMDEDLGVIEASAIEMADNWKIKAGTGYDVETGDCKCTPTQKYRNMVKFFHEFTTQNYIGFMHPDIYTSGGGAEYRTLLFDANQYLYEVTNGLPVPGLYDLPVNDFDDPLLTYAWKNNQSVSSLSDLCTGDSHGGILHGLDADFDNTLNNTIYLNCFLGNSGPLHNNPDYTRYGCPMLFVSSGSYVWADFKYFKNEIPMDDISCSSVENNEMKLVGVFNNPSLNGGVDTDAEVTLYSCCLDGIYNCVEITDFTNICGGPTISTDETCSRINPYVWGMKGIWRPRASYSYKTERNYSADLTNTTSNFDIKNDGKFNKFHRFPWEKSADGTLLPADLVVTNGRWVKSNEMNLYSQHGFELENRNALNIPSAALYGYKESLPIAVASNTTHREIANENFEEPSYSDCEDTHFNFGAYSANYSSAYAHTGKKSLKLSIAGSASLTKDVVPVSESVTTGYAYADCDNEYPLIENGFGEEEIMTSKCVTQCDVFDPFMPTATQKYIFSAWIKEYKTVSSVYQPNFTQINSGNAVIDLKQSGTPLDTYTFTASGPVIDGWQRIYAEFEIPLNTNEIIVTLNNVSLVVLGTSVDVYFDDIRIHPFNASMQTYVYDPVTLKTMATLDENNYATFYIYDEEGKLNKTKVETERGIKTINEGRSNSFKVTP